MKKQIFLIGAIIVSTFSFAQVGINNDNPQATLDISAKTTDNSKPEGIIAPRLTGNEIKAKDLQYTNNQTGALVFATSAVGTPSAKTANITTSGYYYFDGTMWQKINSGSASSTEPWKVQNSSTEATANNQNIYQQGKVAVGFSENDLVSTKQFEVKGDLKAETEIAGRHIGLETNYVGSGISILYNMNDLANPTDLAMLQLHPNSLHIVSQSPTNSASTAVIPGAIESQAGSYGLTDGVSWQRMDNNQIYLSNTSGTGVSTNSNHTGLIISKSTGIQFVHKDGNGSTTGYYTFPRNSGAVGQVLSVATNTSNISTLEWKNAADLIKAAMPKFFYMPTITIPTHDSTTGSVLTGTQTINLYNNYNEQFGYTGGTNQVRSNPTSTIPTLPANELDYFITYYDAAVFENVAVSDTGILTYQVKSTAVRTDKTFMNIVFKVKD